MPVYNSASFLKEAINSILNQTYTNFEFLIINDGSTDETVTIIESFKDNRIRLLNLDKNYGIVTALNKGLELVKGIYLARMDADDISFSCRLEKQVKFLEQNQKIGCLGTNFLWLDTSSEKSWITHFDSEDIRIGLLFGCPICHPTVMLRVDILKLYHLNYSHNYPYAEDYQLWTKIIQYTDIINLKEPLLYYRRHIGQTSMLKNKTQSKSMIKIQLQQLQLIGIRNLTYSDILIHKSLNNTFTPLNKLKYFLDIWCQKLIKNNRKTNYVNPINLNKHLLNSFKESSYYTSIQLSKLSLKQKIYWLITTWFRFHFGKFIKYQHSSI